MTTFCCTHATLLLLLLARLHTILAADTAKVSFINFSDETITLQNGDKLAPYQETQVTASIGDSLVYESQEGTQHSVLVKDNDQVHVIGPETVYVECSTSTGPLTIHIKPSWSPRGAARFSDLVDTGHYNGCALNRVVKAFLTQFGISANYQKRTLFRRKTIRDDDAPQEKIPFQPGYMSFAGSGPDSRTTEVFIVMSDTPQHQLDYFGVNPWETPFGFVVEDSLKTVDQWEASYGDMQPWGNGPDPQVIYQEHGYEYLKEHFPKLDYIQECNIVTKERGEEEL